MLLCMVQTHGDMVRGAIALACQAMRWPDTQTQIRAVAVCRTVAAAAGVPLNPVGQAPGVASTTDTRLHDAVVPGMLQSAVHALATATDVHVISELLLLVRSIYVACAKWPRSPASVLQELGLSVTVENLQQVCSLPLQLYVGWFANLLLVLGCPFHRNLAHQNLDSLTRTWKRT